MTETTVNDFLGGRLRIRQPAQGYRAGVDPVLLAASVPARPGDSVLELGVGSGVALFCLMARVPGLSAVGVERNAQLARLAAKNAQANNLDAGIVEADFTEMPPDIRDMCFDHVIANPPFFDRSAGSASNSGSREDGRGEETVLSEWVDTAIRRLKPRGNLSMIQRIERLPEVLSCLDQRVGDVTALPLAARQGRQAKLFIVRAKKGTKGQFRLLSPFILHSGQEHLRDGDDYSPKASSILRDGGGLDLRALVNM